ncbi:MAG TPA: hypothetical protein VGO80_01325 [Solirubrobacteraceae bacterium]|nr:hypothetical protein [Solirubrobacteraceae bacterium]
MGASISLVAGAAVSLLVASFLFAYDGLPGGADDSVARAALVVDGQPPVAALSREDGSLRDGAVVIRPAAPARRPVRDVARRAAGSTELRSSSTADETRRPTPNATGITDLGPVLAPPAASSGGSAPAIGDGVRQLGDSVTTKVGDTGDAAGNATFPLGPPVSQAVQDVLNIVESLLQGATNGLAGGLDKTLPR